LHEVEVIEGQGYQQNLHNDVEAHPMLDLLGDSRWKLLPEADTSKDVDHDDGDGNSMGSEA
jgi:hypothetical protein